MDRTLDDQQVIVRNRICGFRTERDATPGCGRDPDYRWLRFFPQQVAASGFAAGGDSNRSIQAVRARAGGLQLDLPANGDCQPRHEVRRAINARRLLVVEAVEVASGRSLHPAGMTVAPAGTPAGPRVRS